MTETTPTEPTTTGSTTPTLPVVPCDKNETITNGTITYDTSNHNATYSCDNGYILVGVANRSCDQDPSNAPVCNRECVIIIVI